jgi:hypothetical protein
VLVPASPAGVRIPLQSDAGDFILVQTQYEKIAVDKAFASADLTRNGGAGLFVVL